MMVDGGIDGCELFLGIEVLRDFEYILADGAVEGEGVLSTKAASMGRSTY